MAALSLGEIAAGLPGAPAIFRRHKLDFCCGGSESLESAARRNGLDPAAIETELVRLSSEEPIPDSVEDIIDYILERYHQVHRRELPELHRLAMRVEQLHADHPAVPAGLSDLLARMQAQLDSHMQKEEHVLFPLMRAGGNPMIVHPISMMRYEHEEHGETLKALAAVTGDPTVSDGACETWCALYTGLAKLVEDLTEHMHVENNILFPRFGA